MRALQIVNLLPKNFVFAESWREAIDALHFGLGALGIDAPVMENSFRPDSAPILFGAQHLNPGEEGKLPNDAVLYNFEQLRQGYPWFEERYLGLLRRFRVWDFSARNVEYLHASGISPQARHVPVGYVPQFRRIQAAEQDVDVLFFGRMTDRRKRVLDGLAERGLAVQFLSGVFGEERDRWIARSKVVLNIHAEPGGLFERLRVLYLLANRKAVVTEPGEPGELEPELLRAIQVVPYESLIESCARLADDAAARETLASAGQRIISRPSRRMSTVLRMLPEIRDRIDAAKNLHRS